MNLKDRCKIDEALYNSETIEQYLQFTRHDYDKKNIENLSKMKYLISEIFVRSYSDPKILLLSSIENISDALTKPLELKFYELRSSKIKKIEISKMIEYVVKVPEVNKIITLRTMSFNPVLLSC